MPNPAAPSLTNTWGSHVQWWSPASQFTLAVIHPMKREAYSTARTWFFTLEQSCPTFGPWPYYFVRLTVLPYFLRMILIRSQLRFSQNYVQNPKNTFRGIILCRIFSEIHDVMFNKYFFYLQRKLFYWLILVWFYKNRFLDALHKFDPLSNTVSEIGPQFKKLRQALHYICTFQRMERSMTLLRFGQLTSRKNCIPTHFTNLKI